MARVKSIPRRYVAPERKVIRKRMKKKKVPQGNNTPSEPLVIDNIKKDTDTENGTDTKKDPDTDKKGT